MNKLVLVGVLLGAVSSAAAEDRQGFLGWSKDNTFWAVRKDSEITFCPSTLGDPSWGKQPESEDMNGCLRTGDDGFQPAPGWEAGIVAAPALATLPAGMTFKGKKNSDPSDETTLFTISLGKKKTTCQLYARHDAKPKAFYLRPDGGSLVVDLGVPNECDIKPLGFVPGPPGSAPAAGDRKAATAVTKLAMKAYKAHLWSDAIAGFRQAIALDPGWSNAHYNLASVAAIVGDLATTRSELGWMSKAGDAEAVRLLAKAQKDPDLDAASTDPEVRRLIGLGDYSDLLAEQIATERSGVWSHEGSDCEMPFMLLTFKKNGALTLKLTLECEGKKVSETLKGKWRDDEGVLQLSGGKSKDGTFSLDGTPVNPIKCKGSSVAGSCLAIAGSEDLAFHRGQPEISMGFKY